MSILKRIVALARFSEEYMRLGFRPFSPFSFQCQNSTVAVEKPKDEKDQDWWPRRRKILRRTGVIAVKLGMSHLWDKNGSRVPVTLLQVRDNQVLRIRTKKVDGVDSVQVGADNQSSVKRVRKALLGQFKASRVPPKKKVWEFRVTDNALVRPGTHLYAAHFVPGQYVDVCAKSIGKGFQGVMKRHGMKGQPASHGGTKTHRKMGATGGSTNPGRIWPGKRMPGRMGGKRSTTSSLKVCRINHRFNVLYVKGPVPGHENTYVRVTDAKKRTVDTPLPVPTYFPDENHGTPEEVFAEDIHELHTPTIEFPDKRETKKK